MPRTSVVLEDGLYQEIGIALVHLDLSMQEFMVAAAKEKLEQRQRADDMKSDRLRADADASTYAKKHQPWHDKLELVLSRGTHRDRIGIEQNLDWAVDAINLRAAPVNKRTGTGKF